MKLNMSENKKIIAHAIGGLIKLCNRTPTGFEGIKGFLETCFDRKMLCSKYDVKMLHGDALIPIVDA